MKALNRGTELLRSYSMDEGKKFIADAMRDGSPRAAIQNPWILASAYHDSEL